MVDVPDLDIEDELSTQLAAVVANAAPIEIVGGGSKCFYGEKPVGLPIEVAAHSGIIDYDPAELVITLRSGCRVEQVESLLAQHEQAFAFEPPDYEGQATIGGMLATGLCGPGRAFSGSIRDYVLGVKILNGRAEKQQFGGRVIKNVAGFDVSRLMVGALGTLGLILEASIKVVPAVVCKQTLVFEHATADQHIEWINSLGSEPLPISASMWVAGQSHLRLSGSEQGVATAKQLLGGEPGKDDWSALKQQAHGFFDAETLTRISLPPACVDLKLDNPQLIEWSGAQRWISGKVDIAELRQKAAALGGLVCAFRGHQDDVPMFHPLAPAMQRLQRSLKAGFDPAGIFNPGRMYPGI